jgi:hypothetical protein
MVRTQETYPICKFAPGDSGQNCDESLEVCDAVRSSQKSLGNRRNALQGGVYSGQRPLAPQ